MYGIFDTLGAIAKNPNNNSRMLFFGIPKGTFYKKSPLAGFGAEPHVRGLASACSRQALSCGLIPHRDGQEQCDAEGG